MLLVCRLGRTATSQFREGKGEEGRGGAGDTRNHPRHPLTPPRRATTAMTITACSPPAPRQSPPEHRHPCEGGALGQQSPDPTAHNEAPAWGCRTVRIQGLPDITWPRGPMDKASAYGAGDCRFESCRGHCIALPYGDGPHQNSEAGKPNQARRSSASGNRTWVVRSGAHFLDHCAAWGGHRGREAAFQATATTILTAGDDV